ncbi:MAG: replication-associated recombination protein A, partial [Pseudomonadota bacterium]
IYLANSPKSNSAYLAIQEAQNKVKQTGNLPVPLHLRNAPTKLMKEIGYGEGYAYDHDAADGFSGANYWPEDMPPQRFYEPVERGFETRVKERMEHWERLRQERGSSVSGGAIQEP